MVIKVGVIGYSEGNGHPFSFSAIINGYNDQEFAKADWPVIHNYLRTRPESDFGIKNVRVTHAWTQIPDLTEKLCAACKIDHKCETYEEMIDQVDAILIARDDWETHLTYSLPFLRAGKYVFIDKPLSLRQEELDIFEPYLRSAHLMSCSGMRYARELSELRKPMAEWEIGKVKLISGTVLNDLEKYGIHKIEAVMGLSPEFSKIKSISRLPAEHESYAIVFVNNVLMQLNCLGNVGKTFRLSFFGESGHLHYDLHDNFSAFRETLFQFLKMIETQTPVISPDEVLSIMKCLRDGSEKSK